MTRANKLAALCTEAVRQYIEACGSVVEPSLTGMMEVEAANWRTWKAEGFDLLTVGNGLTAAWADRCGA